MKNELLVFKQFQKHFEGRFAVRDMRQRVAVGVIKLLTPKQAAATKKMA